MVMMESGDLLKMKRKNQQKENVINVVEMDIVHQVVMQKNTLKVTFYKNIKI